MKTLFTMASLAVAVTLALTGCSADEKSAAETTTPTITQTTDQLVAETEAISDETIATAFRAFLDENYAVDMERYPQTASYRGMKANQGKWNSAAESFRQETRAINETRLQQLAEFDRAALNTADQLSYDLYKLGLERALISDDFRYHRFVIHQHGGPHTSVASSLINILRVNELKDAQDYIARLNGVGIWFDQVIEQMEIRTRENFLLADWQYPPIIESSKNVITGAPYDESGEDSTLWADFKAKVAALDVDEATRETLLAEARTALTGVVKPAYLRLIAALEQQAENAPDADGVWKFKDGDKFYAQRLNWYTTTDLSADEVHDIGLREVERIHAEMESIKEKVGFEGSLNEFFVFMREDEQFYYPPQMKVVPSIWQKLLA